MGKMIFYAFDTGTKDSIQRAFNVLRDGKV